MKSKMMKILVAALALASFSLMGCGTTVEDADGNSYPTIKIGNQVLMAKNLNVNVPGSMCYENDSTNCETFGRLYTWEAAVNACPSDWHLPSLQEVRPFVAGLEDHLRKVNGFGSTVFFVLPAGYYDGDYKMFRNLGKDACFWTSSDLVYCLNIVDGVSGTLVDNYNKTNGFSVRCLKD